MAKYFLIALIILIIGAIIFGVYKAIVAGNYFTYAPFGATLIILLALAGIFALVTLIKKLLKN